MANDINLEVVLTPTVRRGELSGNVYSTEIQSNIGPNPGLDEIANPFPAGVRPHSFSIYTIIVESGKTIEVELLDGFRAVNQDTGGIIIDVGASFVGALIKVVGW
jgi:hypothetical protein